MSRAVVLTRGANAAAESLAEYTSRGGYEALRSVLAQRSPQSVIDQVTGAELRGRGGAGFLAAKKWDLARAAEGAPKYLVANAGEHEPGSLKDRVLVAKYPHTVIEGIALASYATGASTAYLYLIEDMTEALSSARVALEEALAAGFLGTEILGSDFSLEIHIQTAPTTYVAGEETAALEVIEGRKAWPRKKPPYPGSVGLFGKPTTVNNVETLAFVPNIVRNGSAVFRALGVRGHSGAMLFTLDESVKIPGVFELPIGTTYRELIDQHGGGTRGGHPVRAILPALSSSFLTAAHLDLPIEHLGIRDAGSNLGCGGVSVLEENQCVVERALEISQFFMREQCGQCPPCRMETNTLAAVMKQVHAGTPNDYRAQIEKITTFARGKGNCSLIEMAAAPILSALKHFGGDFEAHAKTGACGAGLHPAK